MQKILVNDNKFYFQQEVNKHLEQGWKVVPQTMTVVVYAVPPVNPQNQYATSKIEERWSIVLEKA